MVQHNKEKYIVTWHCLYLVWLHLVYLCISAWQDCTHTCDTYVYSGRYYIDVYWLFTYVLQDTHGNVHWGSNMMLGSIVRQRPLHHTWRSSCTGSCTVKGSTHHLVCRRTNPGTLFRTQ